MATKPPNEFQLRRDAERGTRAERLLEDPLVMEAFETLENEYLDYWRNHTALDEVAGRERLWQAVHIVGKVREHLQGIARDGQIANRELLDLSQGRQS